MCMQSCALARLSTNVGQVEITRIGDRRIEGGVFRHPAANDVENLAFVTRNLTVNKGLAARAQLGEPRGPSEQLGFGDLYVLHKTSGFRLRVTAQRAGENLGITTRGIAKSWLPAASLYLDDQGAHSRSVTRTASRSGEPRRG